MIIGYIKMRFRNITYMFIFNQLLKPIITKSNFIYIVINEMSSEVIFINKEYKHFIISPKKQFLIILAKPQLIINKAYSYHINNKFSTGKREPKSVLLT